ncbi:MAG: putative CRISPR-associated protein [Desulfomonile sp.]
MATNGTFILTTVGTSLLIHLRRSLSVEGLPTKQKALSQLKKTNPTEIAAGAEINSIEHLLNGMKLTTGKTFPPFELALLVSDTEDGGWTGELLKEYYSSVRKLANVSWHKVEGLTPNDPRKFSTQGLRSLVREASKLLREAEKKSLFRVINATGGFKAQISFAGLIGQTLGVPVVYLFETFPACVEMPPMPVDFDRDSWLTNYDLFTKLSNQGSMFEEEFPFNEVDPVIRDLLDSYDEAGKRLYSLSPVLELMHQGFLARRPRNVVEPPSSGRSNSEKIALVRKELAHAPKGTEQFAEAMASRFPWIIKIKNHTPKMDSARTHLLPRKVDPGIQWACFSDGQLGVRLSIKTTCEHEGHVEYVNEALAQFLSDW